MKGEYKRECCPYRNDLETRGWYQCRNRDTRREWSTDAISSSPHIRRIPPFWSFALFLLSISVEVCGSETSERARASMACPPYWLSILDILCNAFRFRLILIFFFLSFIFFLFFYNSRRGSVNFDLFMILEKNWEIISKIRCRNGSQQKADSQKEGKINNY